MIHQRLKPSRCALSLAALGLLTGTASANPPAADDGRWRFTLVPYAWFPAVSGSIDTVVTGLPRVGGGLAQPVEVTGRVNPNSYLTNLQMAAMLMGEARKGRWLIDADFMYTNLGSQDTQVRQVTGPRGNLSGQIARTAQTNISTTVMTLAGGYAVVNNEQWSLDLLAGARLLDLASNLTLTLQDARGNYLLARQASMDRQVWDGILGARGEFRFGDSRWFMPYYADIGAGTSNWTWQAMLGLGYRYDWGAVTLAWRALAYDFSRNDADLTLSGPGLGVSIRW